MGVARYDSDQVLLCCLAAFLWLGFSVTLLPTVYTHALTNTHSAPGTGPGESVPQ